MKPEPLAHDHCGCLTGQDLATGRVGTADLQAQLARHGAVLVRGCALDAEGFVALAASLGELRPARIRHPDVPGPAGQYIFVSQPGGALSPPGYRKGDAAHAWHNDYSTSGAIPKLSFLYGLKTPANGSLNAFANMAVAYAALDDGRKQEIAGLSGWHYAHPQGVDELPEDMRVAVPREQRQCGTLQPLAMRDETGRPFLCLPAHEDSPIDGLGDGESRILLRELWAHALATGGVWEHEVQAGEILIWDNQVLAHRRSAWPAEQDRLLWFISTR